MGRERPRRGFVGETGLPILAEAASCVYSFDQQDTVNKISDRAGTYIYTHKHSWGSVSL